MCARHTAIVGFIIFRWFPRGKFCFLLESIPLSFHDEFCSSRKYMNNSALPSIDQMRLEWLRKFKKAYLLNLIPAFFASFLCSFIFQSFFQFLDPEQFAELSLGIWLAELSFNQWLPVSMLVMAVFAFLLRNCMLDLIRCFIRSMMTLLINEPLPKSSAAKKVLPHLWIR